MKKYLFLLALSSMSYFANAADIVQSKPMLAQINSISVYAGDNVDSQKTALKTIDKVAVPDFSHCAVYLPKEQQSASTKITLSRTNDGKFSVSCGS
ncbi:hypothetical protein C0Z01_05070 [Photobacterium kishitanii]|uniref:Uncharacterized protein n=1 Tax=Photobacterium kishitanii TaxID=318456 RepID=A0A2T3QRI3_9GAMM|nr:hypothetical protein [Photobacterium kishitanii]KJG07635.1 hypothetical protein UB40_19030 [Photobacterium kishitanii]KJG57347.1 hypothetical protein UA38_10205 [Photobacterium kishitanii]KJG60823.1 hypothetical protein UA42_12875 [Photobacterium kishitanii]KJG65100.1 hypothetical protein UA40_12755 [Photobacterium kishitanii]KJG69247.1 hypothetical protein UA41_11970 [Photobacterium kishitanii]